MIFILLSISFANLGSLTGTWEIKIVMEIKSKN